MSKLAGIFTDAFLSTMGDTIEVEFKDGRTRDYSRAEREEALKEVLFGLHCFGEAFADAEQSVYWYNAVNMARAQDMLSDHDLRDALLEIGTEPPEGYVVPADTMEKVKTVDASEDGIPNMLDMSPEEIAEMILECNYLSDIQQDGPWTSMKDASIDIGDWMDRWTGLMPPQCVTDAIAERIIFSR